MSGDLGCIVGRMIELVAVLDFELLSKRRVNRRQKDPHYKMARVNIL